MTAQHRAPAAPRRVSNRMIASIVLAVLALMLITVVVAAATQGSDDVGYQVNTESAAYHDGYQGGYETASGPDWRAVGESRAFIICNDALIQTTDLADEELWNAAKGCAAGVMEAQA